MTILRTNRTRARRQIVTSRLTGAAVLAVVVAAAMAATAGADTSAVPGGAAVVRVLDAIATHTGERHLATVADQPALAVHFGQASQFVDVGSGPTPISLAAGSRTVVADTVQLPPGCATTVAATEPDGLDRGVRFLAFPECVRARLPGSSASIRLLNLTADVGTVEARVPGGNATPAAAPFTASARVVVPAGPTMITIGSAGGTRPVEITGSANLRADHAYTLALVGGGESPLTIRRLTDAVQPSDPPPPDQPINTGSDAPRSKHRDTDRRGPRGFRPADPIRLTVPAISVDAPIVATPSAGAPDLVRTLAKDQVAWFAGTNKPGAAGLAVLAGHVVYSGPAVFARLGDLRPGDRLTIWDTADRPRTFTIRAINVVQKGRISPDYYAPAFTPTIVLVSCTGPIDPRTRLHADNVTVIAT